MEKCTVSIIMPVYNVEKYVRESIESVLRQSFRAFELIIVDDCSTDSCGAVCDEYAKNDSRTVVIHKTQNEGLGAARNTGLDAANGEYILFIDSDDLTEENLLQTAVSSIGDSDLAVFGINRFFEDKNGKTVRTEKLLAKGAVLPPEKAFIELTKAGIFNFAWNKLYRRDFIVSCGTRFESTKLIEDFLFNIDVFSKAKKITIIEECLHNYRRPAHETMVNTYSPDFFALSKRKYLLERQLLEKFDYINEETLQTIYSSYLKHLISVFLRNNSKKSGLTEKEQKKLISEALSDSVTQSVLSDFSPQSKIYKILLRFLKKKRVSALFFFTSLYNKLQKSSLPNTLKRLIK